MWCKFAEIRQAADLRSSELVCAVKASNLRLLAEANSVRWVGQVPLFVAPHSTCCSTPCLNLVHQQVDAVLHINSKTHMIGYFIKALQLSWMRNAWKVDIWLANSRHLHLYRWPEVPWRSPQMRSYHHLQLEWAPQWYLPQACPWHCTRQSSDEPAIITFTLIKTRFGYKYIQILGMALLNNKFSRPFS